MKRSVAARFMTLSVLAPTLAGPRRVLAHCDKVFAKTPAVRGWGPAIPAADKAIETETVEIPVRLITSECANGIRERFQNVGAAKKFNAEDVSAGREYVKAYVEFVHDGERLHESVQGGRDQHPKSASVRPERQKGSLPWLMQFEPRHERIASSLDRR